MASCTQCGAPVSGEDLKFCAYCGARLNVIDENLGKAIHTDIKSIKETVSAVAAGLHASGGHPDPPPGEGRTCPFCAEVVKAEATVCRHCGRNLPAVDVPIPPPVQDVLDVAADRYDDWVDARDNHDTWSYQEDVDDARRDLAEALQDLAEACADQPHNLRSTIARVLRKRLALLRDSEEFSEYVNALESPC